MRRLKGISPVVATALLVLIAVAVSVLLYAWVSGTVSNQPASSKELQERIKIDAVDISAGSTSATIYVHNIGSTPVNITSAYVINATSGKVLGGGSISPVSVNPGSVQEVTVNLDTPPKKGDTLLIKVATSDGVEATYITTVS